MRERGGEEEGEGGKREIKETAISVREKLIRKRSR